MELLDRAEELRRLSAALARARRGEGSCVLVCGEAGVGKTALIDTFLADADDIRTFRGVCDDLLAPRPFGPLRDLVIGSADIADDVLEPMDRERLLAALLDAMDSRIRPAVVFIDDAQWLDDASLDVIRFLSRRMAELPALLLIAFREEHTDDRAPIGRAIASTGPDPVRIQLGPLTSEAIADLVAGTTLDSDEVYELTGGNPFLATQMMMGALESKHPSGHDLLTHRTYGLSGEAVTAAEIMAVIPQGANAALLRSLFGDNLAPIDELERSGMVTPVGDRLRFRHEMLRRSVEANMSFARRIESNRAVLDQLEALGAEPTTLVHHAVEAGEPARAAAFARACIPDAVRDGSHREAWRLCRTALSHRADLDAAQIRELHGTAALSAMRANLHHEAMYHAQQAVDVCRKLVDGMCMANALLDLAIVANANGENHRMMRALREGVILLENHPRTEVLARCYAMLAGGSVVLGDCVEAKAWANLAIDIAEPEEWWESVIHAYAARGLAQAFLGDPGGFEDLHRAIELGTRHGPAYRHAVNLYNLSVCYIRFGRPIEADEYIGRCIAEATRHGYENHVYRSRVQQALVLLLRGSVAEAELLLESLVSDDADPGAIISTTYAVYGRLLTRRGDARAATMIADAWDTANTSREPQKIALAAISRMEHLWLEQQEEELREFAWDMLEFAEDITHVWLRAEALRHLARLGEDVKPFEACPPGYAHGIVGEWQEAAAAWQEVGQPYEQALELVSSPDRSAAFEGLRMLDGLGAARTADVVRLRLREQGLQGVPRGPRSSRAENGGLTNRQLDVVRLIAEGLTNLEIADALYVSRRTVDNHVSAILTRLGVASRSDAVTAAAALGLLDAEQTS